MLQKGPITRYRVDRSEQVFPTGIIDIDKELLSYFFPDSLRAAGCTNKYLSTITSSDDFWRIRLSRAVNHEFEPVALVRASYKVLCGILIHQSLGRQLVEAGGLGNIELIAALISQGASFEHGLMISATRAGYLDVFEYLWLRVDFKFVGSLIATAAECGHRHILEYLARVGAITDSSDTIYAINSSIVLAAGCGHVDIIEFLIGQGADIFREARRATEQAAISGHLHVIRYLLSKGVHPPRGECGAALRAAAQGHLDVVAFFLDHGTSLPGVLRTSAIWGQVAVAQMIIDRWRATLGDDGDLSDQPANTSGHREGVPGQFFQLSINSAVRLAATSGHLDMVKFLEENGGYWS